MENVLEWKNNLFPDVELDKLVVLEFDVCNKEYKNREHSFGDFSTSQAIKSEDIRLLTLFENDFLSSKNIFDCLTKIKLNTLQIERENLYNNIKKIPIKTIVFDRKFYNLVGVEGCRSL